MSRIAIIGAGVAGSTAAQVLSRKGHTVTVFDKSRGTGGRIACRQTEFGAVDHGTPYFEVTRPEIELFCQGALSEGVLQKWQPRFVRIMPDGERVPEQKNCLVGVPTMSRLTRFLLQSSELITGTRIVEALHKAEGWTLKDEKGLSYSGFEQLIITTPPLQAMPLLTAAPSLQEQVCRPVMECCWVAILESGECCQAPYDIAVFEQGALRRIVSHHAKPGRPERTVWQIQASPAWSAEHQDLPKEQVAALLAEVFIGASGITPPRQYKVWAHRWLYGFTAQPLQRPCLYDAVLSLGVCGDWMLGRTVEDAAMSALQLVTVMSKPG
ncbi:MAG: NAD(P)-binding protein [Deltaproteobacteria bacterium]|jgi:hypothetical protein|nr:NAD(P)-binding protein [Deltaproteobacteria bacterium]